MTSGDLGKSPNTFLRCKFRKNSCRKCKGEHGLNTCQQFKTLNVSCRNRFVNSNKLCFNCFLSNHTVSDCKSPATCKYCGKRHNSFVAHVCCPCQIGDKVVCREEVIMQEMLMLMKRGLELEVHLESLTMLVSNRHIKF